ncbi:2-C-methyl-D-erythritol 2,4-cyclodiphosphate synthase [Burkholderiales bacterium GJ-E10]|nr:2-C-methyl-D-erythritol 2,4-cyclodiphosphate synthase [Burkholderiales bacterium GJ-E10]
MVMRIRVGQGFDVHALVAGRKLILAGVAIEYPLGLAGHSDADVLAHAVIDALLGAAGLGDIGAMFPDTDERYRGADSMRLLDAAWARVRAEGWRLGNLDCTVVAQQPKIAPYVDAMRTALAAALGVEKGAVSVKGKTTEKLGFTGRGEGIAAMVSALLAAD